MNYTEHLDNEEQFKDQVKLALNQQAFSAMQDLKQELANDFIQPQEDDYGTD
jgi:hypothetical protein